VTPIATISGNQTGLSGPYGIALDSNRNIYVADLSANSVFTYPALGSSTGLLNEAPTATISGPLTELGEPQFIAVQPAVAPTPTATATTTPTAAPTATPAPVQVKLKISPASLNFGTVKVGSSKGPKNITVSNPKGSKKKPGLTVVMEGLSGGGSPFTVTNGCDAPLAPAAKCTIGVTFKPTAAQPYNATLTIIDNAEHEPQPVKLKGKGKV
jgi:hypothetical protein